MEVAAGKVKTRTQGGTIVIDSPEEVRAAPRVRVAAAIVTNGEILLARHAKNGKSYWLLPGGGVEYGEGLVEAVERELWEEAKVEIHVENLLCVADTIHPDKHRHIVHVIFAARITAGTPKVGADDRVVEIRFMPIERLVDLEFYPHIAKELTAMIQDDCANVPRYLRAVWKEN